MTKALSIHANVLAYEVRLFLVCLLALSFLPSAYGHQQKTAVTRILFNPNTGNIEVMHRFLIHDAEHAAGQIFGRGQTLLESEESRELFANYVVNRFAIQALKADGSALELKLDYIGEEIDGQFIWVYQETNDTQDISGLSVFNSALRDVWPDQSNLVNIEKAGEIYSLNFADSAQVLTVEL